MSDLFKALSTALLGVDFELKKMPEFPMEAVIYFLLRDGKVVYVGQTTNLLNRMMWHVREKQFHEVFYFACPGDLARRLYFEQKLINAFKPELNKTIQQSPVCG